MPEIQCPECGHVNEHRIGQKTKTCEECKCLFEISEAETPQPEPAAVEETETVEEAPAEEPAPKPTGKKPHVFCQKNDCSGLGKEIITRREYSKFQCRDCGNVWRYPERTPIVRDENYG